MFSVSLGAILTPKRNWRQCLCKILGWQTKTIMVCYGIFWSGQLHWTYKCCSVLYQAVLKKNKCRSSFSIGVYSSSLPYSPNLSESQSYILTTTCMNWRQRYMTTKPRVESKRKFIKYLQNKDNYYNIIGDELLLNFGAKFQW